MAILGGTDDRTLVVQTTAGPWKFVGLWEVDAGAASGVLIGDQYVLTAQHVFSEMFTTAGTFTPAYDKVNGIVSAPYGEAHRDSSKPSSGYFDIAMVHVDETPSGIVVKDIPGMVLFLDPDDAKDEHVSSAGYAVNKSDGERMYSIADSTITDTFEDGTVLFSDTMDVAPRQSGSPIFYTFNGEIYTAGVLSGEDPAHGQRTLGTLFTSEMYSNFMGLLYATEGATNPADLPENLIVGGDGANQFDGTHRRERIVLGKGNDTVLASLGDDTIDGGRDYDTVDYRVDPPPVETASSGSEGPVPQPLFSNVVATLQADTDVEPGARPGLLTTVAFDNRQIHNVQQLRNVEHVFSPTSQTR
jgi:V8-like Glu-specific endopeptidase